MAYREAESLKVLHREVNKAAPNRSTRSDGWIGDASHASRTSDHNPWVKDSRGVGVVRARDFTQDPKGGLDAGKLAVRLSTLLGKHPALGSGAYIIWNWRIISTDRVREGWRRYYGPNGHTTHMHVSVGLNGYDATAPWNVMNAPTKKEDVMNKNQEQKLDNVLKEVRDFREVWDKVRSNRWKQHQKVLELIRKRYKATESDLKEIKAILEADE